MIAMVCSSAVVGLEALPVNVEVRVQEGKSSMTIIGLTDSAIQESRERIVSCLEQNGFDCSGRTLVNLAPAEVKKEGSSFDLPIAMGILLASRQISIPDLASVRFVGELSLDGRVRPVKGVIAHVIEALESGASRIIVPYDSLSEAKLIEGIEIIGVRRLGEVVRIFREGVIPEVGICFDSAVTEQTNIGLSDVSGQDLAKRALVVAAAGAHNVLMIGPPGCGKSMLAKRFPRLLPPLSKQDALEVARIHSIAGLDITETVSGIRPFRAPHHVITQAGLIGGGSTNIRPGEVSLAHQGVLFLDEFPEYKRGVLEAMRAPLEDGRVRVSRARGSYIFPSRFQLLAAMNPCPCGNLGSSGRSCKCSRSRVEGYLQKLSQPILDRIDLHIEMYPVKVADMKSISSHEADALIAQIARSHQKQMARGFRNADASFEKLTDESMLSAQAMALVEKSAERLELSARSVVRVLRVARTVADLAEDPQVSEQHVAEALEYRSLDRIRAFARGL